MQIASPSSNRFRSLSNTGLNRRLETVFNQSIQEPKPENPRFGAVPVTATLGPINRGLASLYNWLETSYEPGFLIISKIFGNTVPRVAICRTDNERKDVLFNEVTQGALMFITLPLFSPIANWMQDKFYGGKDISAKDLRLSNAVALRQAKKAGGAQQLRRLRVLKLGKAFGVSAIVAAGQLAISYVRNYRTIKKTGFADYKSVVGLGGQREPTAAERKEADKEAQKALNKVYAIMAGGVALGIAGMGGAGMLARRVNKIFSRDSKFSIKYMDQKLKDLFKHWALVGEKNNQINSVFKSTKQTLWVWGVPAYMGWLLACRDKYEVVEQLSKFATFVGGYVGVPKLAGWMRKKLDKGKWVNSHELLPKLNSVAEDKKYDMTRMYNQLMHKMGKTHPKTARSLIKLWNANNMAVLALNVFVIGALPIVFNIFFSSWRFKREEAERQANLGAYKFQHPGGRLYRKSFQSWGVQQSQAGSNQRRAYTF